MAKKVFWDKGHGGSDPGAVGNGLNEKDITYLIVEHAMWYLNEHYTGFVQNQSRSGDETLSLNQRTNEANRWGADLLVSVHVNAGGGKGFETFIYNGNAGSSTIAFQNVLHTEVLAAMRKHGSITDRGKKRANFHMLRESSMIAVLSENLFIDTKSDADKLKDKDGFLKDVGHAHARAVAKFLGLPTKNKPVAPPKKEGEKVNVITGWYEEGSEGLAELEAFLKSKGWYYRKEKS